MRVLHAAHLPFWSGGVALQMRWEQEAANSLNVPWDSRVFLACDAQVPPSAAWTSVIVKSQHSRSQIWGFRREYYRWLLNTADNYDAILLRYSNYNPLQTSFLLRCRRPVFLVHHTLEVPEIRGLGAAAAPAKAVAEEFLGKVNMSLASGNVSVTQEIADYENARSGARGKATYIYPNGIAYSSEENAATGAASPSPSLLFVASYFFSWHGLDLLLAEISRSPRQFTLHLVGDMRAADRQAAEADARVVLHGVRDARYIRALSEECWIGLSSFALDRKEMKQACTLKVRESLQMGLPVYAGHQDVFPPDFRYYHSGRCDIGDILDFATTVRDQRGKSVSDTARTHIDKAQLLLRLYDEMSGEFAASCRGDDWDASVAIR